MIQTSIITLPLSPLQFIRLTAQQRHMSRLNNRHQQSQIHSSHSELTITNDQLKVFHGVPDLFQVLPLK